MSTDPNPGKHQQAHEVENLDNHECWRLLRGVSVGRLAVWVDDHPDIFPINYKVDHGTLVFRTADGTKLQAATATPRWRWRPTALTPTAASPGVW